MQFFPSTPVLLLAYLPLYSEPSEPCAIDRDGRSLILSAIFNPKGFSTDKKMSGYHLIVWREGKAAQAALFQVDCSDRLILGAIKALGLVPSNNLKEECWSHRNEMGRTAPDQKAEGPKLEVSVRWEGSEEWTPVYKLFASLTKDDFDFRFTGNEALIPVWKSGCIACLYSCPGGKLSNAAYSVRDFTKQPARFRLSQELPPAGTTAQIKVQLVPEKSVH